MLPPHRPLHEDFTATNFSAYGYSRRVWSSGTGPAVVVMHEVPGITPAVARLARVVRDQGFAVFLPEFFGTVDRAPTLPYLARELAVSCIRREFVMFATGKTSPATRWCRALAHKLRDEHPGRGVGALGMCLTGNFALAMMIDPWVVAPVLSQPSLPTPIGPGRHALNLSADELTAVKRAAASGTRVLGLRFTNDLLCPKARFQRLRAEFGDRFESIEIDSSLGNRHRISPIAHSVLTDQLVDDSKHPTHRALSRVLEFFDKNLVGAQQRAAAQAER